MATFLDITDWEEKKHLQTRGTRDKCVVEDPISQHLYYFKTSLNKGNMNYKYEFWSEIIASYVGQALGFNTLKYDIAKNGEKVGCISKAMNIKPSALIEGRSFLTGYDNTYHPEVKSSHESYTLDFIINTLKSYNLNSHIESFYKVLIFDYIICNSDRHQENWGFISKLNNSLGHKLYLSIKLKKRLKKYIIKLIPSPIISNLSKSIVSPLSKKFSPIYDNGSCLAREISDEKVYQMLNNQSMFMGFINRGVSELRKNDGLKYKHLDLVNELKKRSPDFINSEIRKIIKLYDEHKIKTLVYEVDKNLPKELSNFALPQSRKELIINILGYKITNLKLV